jgi:leucyl aminopeptidase (aminopeptidase T)
LVSFEEMLVTARMAVKVCAEVKRGEDVLIVTDTNMMKIADVLAKASREVGAETAVSIMSPREIHGNEPPKTVAAAMKAADVVFTPATYSITHTDAMVDALLRRRSVRLAEKMSRSRTVHITSEYGTDSKLSIENRQVFVLSGFATEPGTFAALPDGEVPVCPVEGSAEGIIVFDQTMDGIGILKKPIRLTVKGGNVVEVQGGEGAERLRKIIDSSDDGATNIAEFAIGTNPKALLIGNMAEDKKKEGSVHIAIGDNHNLGGCPLFSL